MNPRSRDLIFSRMIIEPQSGCLLWTGRLDKDGYPLGYSGTRIHRLMYKMFAGPIPGGLELDHLCRVRNCVNVAHLEPVTHRENTLRGQTIPAANAAKTHCPKGHEYTPENTSVRRGERSCRTCRRKQARESARLRRSRNRSAA